MRRKIARALRKWADLIDPRINPTRVLTVRVECDASEFQIGIDKVKAAMKDLRAVWPQPSADLDQ